MVVRALSLSFSQLGDRAIIGIFAKSMLITLLLTGALAAVAGYGLSALVNVWVDRSVEDQAITYLAGGVAGALGAVAIFVFGFRAIAVPVMSFFGDEVVAAVEARHYPDAAGQARRAGLGVAFRLGIRSFLRFVIANLVLLPVYIFLIFTAIGPLILFLGVNGVLLGRDLGEMVAVRHMDENSISQWLANTRVERALLGLAVTGLFLIPLANLAAPVLGAAAAAHLFHGRPRR
jgi:uncharacterized protein involved in cysteine biosynthesis